MKWYKHDPEAFKGGTLGLSLEEIGAYVLILDDIYARETGIPDDQGYGCRLLRCDPRVWRRVRARLVHLGKLQVQGQTLTNLRAMSEISSAKLRLTSRQNPNNINEKTPVRARATTTTRKKDAPNGAPQLDLGSSEESLPKAARANSMIYEKGRLMTQEAQLFQAGKDIFGANSGGLIAKLLKAKNGVVPLARAAIEMASTKQNPREYIAKIIRGEADRDDWHNALAL